MKALLVWTYLLTVSYPPLNEMGIKTYSEGLEAGLFPSFEECRQNVRKAREYLAKADGEMIYYICIEVTPEEEKNIYKEVDRYK